MKLGLAMHPKKWSDRHLAMARQLGCETVVAWVPFGAGDGVWHAEDFERIFRQAAKHGFHPGGENVMNLWKGDGLQIAFDTMKNAQKMATGYDDEDFEYDLAMFNGKPTVFRRKASLAYHDSLHKPLGVVEDVALDIAHEGRRTIYTIKFSPQAVSPFRLDRGESMRFAVLANLCDGETRYGALETAPGILVEGKWPYGFQEIVLVGQDGK